MKQSIFNSQNLQDHLAKINKSGKRTPARLRALVQALADWAETQAGADTADNSLANINAEDINALREVISRQVSQGRYANLNVLTDQILFILIGALKSRGQKQLAKTWELTMLSIDTLLSNAHRPLIPAYWKNVYVVLFSSIFLWGGYGFASYASKPPMVRMPASLPEPEFAQSPYIPTHLHSFRSIMMQASCEYPQAAMLPIEQRVAFLDFIRNGQIALTEVRNLETALSRVDCFYASTINDSTIN